MLELDRGPFTKPEPGEVRLSTLRPYDHFYYAGFTTLPVHAIRRDGSVVNLTNGVVYVPVGDPLVTLRNGEKQ